MSTDTSEELRPDLSGMIEKVLANPELIGMVASAMGMQNKGGETVVEKQGDESAKDEGDPLTEGLKLPDNIGEKLPEIMKAIAPMVSAPQKGNQRSAQNDRTCLLNALKPYLSEERRKAIDYMIGLGRLTDIIQKLG